MPHQEHYDFLARSGGASRNKRRSNWSSTAFLVESLVLLFFLIACLAVFTQMFAHSWLASSDASRLSAACVVAQNAAEDFEANPRVYQNGAFDVNDANGTNWLPREPHRRKRSYGSRHHVYRSHCRKRRYRRGLFARGTTLYGMGAMTKKAEGLRVGPITLVTLIAALLLAVLATLCATTANAQVTMANRQATSLTEAYAIDSCGQRMVAGTKKSRLVRATSQPRSRPPKLDAIANNAKAADGASDLNIESEYDGSTVFSLFRRRAANAARKSNP